jgi:hypothetical protein
VRASGSYKEMDAPGQQEIERVRLHPEDLELLALRVADLVRGEPVVGYIGTAGVARMLSVSQEWVRGHARELGGVRLGDGPRSALRFDVERVRSLMERRSLSERSGASSRRRGRPPAPSVQLLPLPKGAR